MQPGSSTVGALRRHRLQSRTDIHATTGSGGYADFWIKPDIFLSSQAIFFVGYGQIHDTNLSAANTDHPVITGVRLVY